MVGSRASADDLLTGVKLLPENDEPAARVLIAGDACLGRAHRPLHWSEGAKLRELQGEMARHDLRIVNLECPLTSGGEPIPKVGPHLRSSSADARILRAGGFDVAALANNHIRDYGPAGVRDTLSACREAELLVVGAGEDAEQAQAPLVLDVSGLRLGIIAFAENEFSISGPERPGASGFDPLTAPLRIADLRRRADAVLVLYHAGSERYPLPSPGVVRTCHSLVDAGATAVVCCHTHVMSGLEEHDGAPIVYSLGNFLFGSPPGLLQPPDWYLGYCASLTFVAGGVRQYRIIPFRQDPDAGAVLPLGGVDAQRSAGRVAALSEIIADGDRLDRAWSQYCGSRRADYFAGLLGLTRLERGLLRRAGVWPVWRIKRSRLLNTLNIVRCESHRETVLTLLEEETGGLADRQAAHGMSVKGNHRARTEGTAMSAPARGFARRPGGLR